MRIYSWVRSQCIGVVRLPIHNAVLKKNFEIVKTKVLLNYVGNPKKKNNNNSLKKTRKKQAFMEIQTTK